VLRRITVFLRDSKASGPATPVPSLRDRFEWHGRLPIRQSAEDPPAIKHKHLDLICFFVAVRDYDALGAGAAFANNNLRHRDSATKEEM